jgi:prepilin-type N-terminal cleavage/methylation domain-containing protein
MKNKKAFTLLEMIIAMMITGILLTLTANVLAIFRKAAGQGVTIYAIQTDIRRSITSVSDKLRNSAQIYILPEKFFNANRTLPTDFSFIGVEEVNGKKVLVNYVLNAEGTGHDRKVIAESNADAEYRLELEKSENGEEIVGLKIIIENSNGTTQEVSTSVKALNSMHVSDWSGGTEGICIAYSQDAEAGMKVTEGVSTGGGAIVSFVLDCSGSMSTPMNVNDVGGYSRMYYLRVAGKKFVEKLSTYDGVYLGVQGFDVAAPLAYHKELLNLADTDSQTFYSDLFDANAYASGNQKYPDILPIGSSTNIGDGLRMGYHNMIKESASLGVESLNKYIALVTDGEPNIGTVQGGSSYFGDLRVGATGVTTTYNGGLEYAVQAAKYIKNTETVSDYFIITIGSVSMNNFYKIAEGFGIDPSEYSSHIFSADNDIDFMLAIEKIAGKISIEVERSYGTSLLEGVED